MEIDKKTKNMIVDAITAQMQCEIPNIIAQQPDLTLKQVTKIGIAAAISDIRTFIDKIAVENEANE